MASTDRDQVAKEYEEYRVAGRVWGQVPIERISQIRFARVANEILDEFLTFDDLTTTVSDALDALGIRGVVAGSHLPGLISGSRIAGTATTVRSIPERKTTTQGYNDKDIIKMSTRESYYLGEPRDVLVCDFGGNLDVSNMGGQSATVAKSRNFSGAIVNGAVRDVSTIRKLGFPVWAKGITPMTGKFRMEAVEMNGPVTVHDVAVYPGDLVLADESGVCFVPPEHVGYVLEQLRSVAKEEEVMRGLIDAGRPLDELRPLYRKRYS